jgi:mycothiol synthase
MLAVLIRQALPSDAAAARLVCTQALSFEPDAAILPEPMQNLTRWPAEVAGNRLGLTGQIDGAVAGITFGGIRKLSDGRTVGHVDLLAVAPKAQGHGLGRALLTEMEQQLAVRGATEIRLGYNAPVYLWPGIDPRYTAMTCLADRAGYQRFAEAVDLTADLASTPLDTSADEHRLALAGIAVRRADPAEAADVADWLRRGPWSRSSWPLEAAAAMAGRPPSCHLASLGPEYIGFACYGVNRASWFGPMGTLSEYRRQGIGSVLLLRCLADIAAAGHPVAQISWAGPVRYYARTLGARIDRVYWAYRKPVG